MKRSVVKMTGSRKPEAGSQKVPALSCAVALPDALLLPAWTGIVRSVLIVVALLAIGLALWPQTTVQAQDATATPTAAAPKPAVQQPAATLAPTPVMIRFKVFVSPLTADLKAAPDANAQTAGQVRGGQALDATGRNSALTWLMVIFPANSDGRAWIPVAQVRIYSDMKMLPVMGEKAGAPVAPQPTPTPGAPAAGAPTAATPTAAAPAAVAPAAQAPAATTGTSGRVMADPLNVRAGPTTNDAAVTQLKTDDKVQIVGRSDDGKWLQVVYDAASGARGWVAAQFVEASGAASVAPAAAAPAAAVPVTTTLAPLPASGMIARVTVESLNVRSGPGTNYAAVSRLALGAQVKISGRNQEGTWWEVIYDTTTSAKGWVIGQLVETTADAAQAPVATPAALPAAAAQTAGVTASGLGFTGTMALLTSSGGTLFLVNANGTNLRQITAGVLDPNLSPDSARIAYTRWGGTDNTTVEGIFVYDLASSNEWKMWGSHLPRTPVWSPDGRYIIFSHQQGGQEGYKEYEVCRGPACFYFTLGPDPNWRIGHLDTGSSENQFRDMPSVPYAQNPTWAPDGQRIMYQDDRGFEITTLSGPSQAVNQMVEYRNPNWSPVGGLVAFEYKYQSNGDIWVMNEDGTSPRRLTSSDSLSKKSANNVAPAWSPDGQWIAFLSDRSGKWEVYVMKSDGSQQQPMFPGGLSGVTFDAQGLGERLLDWSR